VVRQPLRLPVTRGPLLPVRTSAPGAPRFQSYAAPRVQPRCSPSDEVASKDVLAERSGDASPMSCPP
jgi:hypothetical protein